MKDPYATLGVSRTAGEAEIKKAFRNLAKKYHPDAAAPAQRASAQKRFQEISAAYEILGDKTKRAEYDAGGIDMGGGAPRGGFEGYPFGRGRPEDFNFAWGGRTGGTRGDESGFRPEDLFADLLGGLGGRRGRGSRAAGQDVNLKLTVGLTEAAQGGTKRIRLPGGEEVNVKIPAGLKDGQTIRLKGRGAPGMGGGPAGDALIQVTVAADARFACEGRNLKTDLAVSLKEAVLGGKVPVETLSGVVYLTVPPGANSGTVLRLKGKGLPAHDGEAAGDLHVRLMVTLPGAADADLKRFVEHWKNEYDPRRT
jgi:DnaJ-class molecular chaperone